MRRSRTTIWVPLLTCGEMNDAHRAVRRVDALSAGAPRPERVDAKVLQVNMDVQLRAENEKLMEICQVLEEKSRDGGGVYLHGLRQDDDRHGSCVDALHPGGETDLGDPLHAMSSTFVLQMSIDVLTTYPHRRVVQTA